MKEKHYKEELSAFLNHELLPDQRQAVGEHLLSCQECRQEHDELRFGVSLAGNLKQADAPEHLWDRIEANLNAIDSRPNSLTAFLNLSNPAFASVLVLFAVVIGAFVYLKVIRTDSTQTAGNDLKTIQRATSLSWQVETISGSPNIVNSEGTADLKIGGTLETDENSSVKIDIADIGHVEVAPNSLVKLVNSSDLEHRLALERGALEARIYAPPRLFVVDTPSAAAVDLGCAYRLEVDDDGNSKLQVSSGYVSLERDGLESMVPAGAACLTRRGKGLGTPFLETTSTALKDALLKFDFDGGADSSLEIILKESRKGDTLTLWHLLSRVPAEDREKVFNRAVKLVSLPAGVEREGILRLDKDMLERWRGEMELFWYVY